jgi:hypothetical protein
VKAKRPDNHGIWDGEHESKEINKERGQGKEIEAKSFCAVGEQELCKITRIWLRAQIGLFERF